MKKFDEVLESLHPLERQVLKHLKDNQTARDIAKTSNMKEVEVMRALQWLETKEALNLEQTKIDTIDIDKNGTDYLEKGFPEKRFLKAILESSKALDKIREIAKLDKDETSISLGFLKRNGFINLGKEISLTNLGKNYINSTINEDFLKSLPKEKSKLSTNELNILKDLQKRKEIIKLNTKKIYTVKINDLGKKLSQSKLNLDLIDSLTPEIIKTNSWKDKKFRRYDVSASTGASYAAKRHIVSQATNNIRKVWLDMGFKEMPGPIVESSFWNFDALFTPQDHPAREMHDTFFVEGTAKLPDKKLVNKVKKEHESKWNYKWDEKIAKEKILRTHTTVVSAKTLANLKDADIPSKFFSVSKVFRNEALDWSHLFELIQVEGFVVDPNANFRDLMGYLKQFYKKLGYNEDQIRFRPGYFPYVEPGLEIDVFHPKKKKWVELGGAGILRPEVVIPLLGKDIPVLAWGQGLERGISQYYDITDIRDLYKNDLKQLRTSKVWLN
ncbi:phenylalanine--tRNA ligase subunit alpha [Candidatus Woesearchaeota archaeon]|jgi:phenylalanyl-tRNA synthetase alpha chain|nr:phenylalanine--tRNA ligase subunit alpha [Candidatus Woesearchaeota archaeon]MBT6044977.1 phenylalanine--tRNA ligase subunit alpha [Candidatus Woesearchaeota archaeon]